MQNLLRLVYEKILLLSSAIIRGDYRLSHALVDDGNETGEYPSSRILINDGPFESKQLLESFKNRADNLEPLSREFIIFKIGKTYQAP